MSSVRGETECFGVRPQLFILRWLVVEFKRWTRQTPGTECSRAILSRLGSMRARSPISGASFGEVVVVSLPERSGASDRVSSFVRETVKALRIARSVLVQSRLTLKVGVVGFEAATSWGRRR
jgi:hypothetical protein